MKRQLGLPAFQARALQLMVQMFELDFCQLVLAGLDTHTSLGQPPMEAGAVAAGRMQALVEFMDGDLESVFAQPGHQVLQGEFPGFGRGRHAGYLGFPQMMGNVLCDPVARRGVGKRRTVVKAKLRQIRQTLQQQGEAHFQLRHGRVSLQRLQALPDHTNAVQPEHRR